MVMKLQQRGCVVEVPREVLIPVACGATNSWKIKIVGIFSAEESSWYNEAWGYS